MFLQLLVVKEFSNFTVRRHHLLECGQFASQFTLTLVLLFEVDSGQVVNELFLGNDIKIKDFCSNFEKKIYTHMVVVVLGSFVGFTSDDDITDALGDLSFEV